MHLIDSHCHLTFDGLYERIDDVIGRARDAGVREFVTVATDAADAVRALDLHRRHSCVHVAAGVHPHEAGRVESGWDAALLETVQHDSVCAVGEMGLDYHYDFADRAKQDRVFRRQLEIATEVDKPIIIHCREAHADVMAILRGFDRVRGVVFHCFTGTESEASEILERGHWLSLTGIVTFKRSESLRRVAKMVPDDRVMVETDSPYLSPEPVRNARPNEPAHLVHTARCIAEQRGTSLDDLTALSAENTRRFFSLAAPDAGL